MPEPKNEEHEIDLTIGFNKQLVSIVFIIFVLFGVVFSMGYFVGRASSSGENGQANASAKGSDTNGGQRPDPAGAVAPQQSQAGAPSQTTPEQPLQPGDAAVNGAPANATQAPVSQPPAAQPPVSAPAKQPEAPKPAETATSPGTFLQVAAVKHEQARMLSDVLKDKGFRTVLVPVTVEGQQLYRTLVGPLKDATDVAKTRAELEGAGFKPIIKKF